MFTQGQIKIIRASPEGWCECEVWPVEQGCNNGPFVDHDSNALLSPTDQESCAQAPFHWHDLLSCALCRSQLLKIFKEFVSVPLFSPSDVTRHQDSDGTAGGNGEFWFVASPPVGRTRADVSGTDGSTCVCRRCPRVFPFVCQCRVGREGSFMLPLTFTTPCLCSSSLYSSVRFFPKTLGRLESFE